MKNRDLLKYLILSSKKNNIANIIDCSYNLCHVFGYKKSEIIGKNINILIPELFHRTHDKLLFNFNEKSHTFFLKNF